MSTIKSSSEHLVLNADGALKDIKFQANGVEKASINSSGLFTSTTIDATKLTGNLPTIDGSQLTGISAGLTNGSNVVSTTITDARTQSVTTSWADITGGFQASITPSATTSDILVMLNMCSSNNASHHFFRVVRDGNLITGGVGDTGGSRHRTLTEEYYTGFSSNKHSGSASWFVDTSISTTSSVTYKVQITGSVSTARINRGGADTNSTDHGRSLSTLTLIELL